MAKLPSFPKPPNWREPDEREESALQEMGLQGLFVPDEQAFIEQIHADIAREAKLLHQEHPKLDLMLSGVVALGLFLLSTVLTYLLSPEPVKWVPIIVGILVAVASVPLVLAGLWCYFRVVEAPRSLIKKTRKELLNVRDHLVAEKAKNAKPNLQGRIICADISPTLNYKFTDAMNDCFLTLFAKLTNDGAPTMVSRWEASLLWEGTKYTSVRGSVKGYYVNRPHAYDRGAETRYETLSEALTEFPNDEEITNTNYKTGWLRFSVGSLPSQAIVNGRLRNEVILRLHAFDSKDDPHVIYEEDTTVNLSGCGKIERLESSITDKQNAAGTGLPDISFELTRLDSERYNDGVKYMLPRFTYTTGVGVSPKVEVKANLTIFDDSSMRMKEYSGAWHGSKIRSKRFTSDDSGQLVLGLVKDEGIVAYEYNTIKTVNGTELSPKLTELDGTRFYVLVVLVGRTADEVKLFEKKQWFGIDAGPEPRFIGLMKQPEHIV